MIRVFTSNYTPADYARLAYILQTGMSTVCPNVMDCDSCKYQKVCIDVLKAKDFCEKKSKPFD